MMQKSPAFFQPATLAAVYRLIAEAKATAWLRAQSYAVLLLDASKSYTLGPLKPARNGEKNEIKGFYSERCHGRKHKQYSQIENHNSFI